MEGANHNYNKEIEANPEQRTRQMDHMHARPSPQVTSPHSL
jgi:hypothetical protein